MVELGLMFPLLVLFLFAAIDFGWALRNYVTITNAAREGARYGVNCYTDAAIITHTESHSSGLLTAADADDVQVLENPCSTDSYVGAEGLPVKVRANYEYDYVTPVGAILSMATGGILPNPLPLNATTTMRTD
jgi:Flp pilus assembly protein TadG